MAENKAQLRKLESNKNILISQICCMRWKQDFVIEIETEL